MELDLTGRTAIVTGGSRGIGKAISLALASEGANLVLVARNREGLDATAQEIGDRVHVLALEMDLQDPETPERVVDLSMTRLGRIDILVNNTGASLGGDSSGTSHEDMTNSFAINVEAPFALSKEVIPHMTAAGYGRIVMVSSIYGRETGGKLAYNATKAAEISVSKTLAREVAGAGITVNNVAPGSIRYTGGSWDKRVLADPEAMAAFVKQEFAARAGLGPRKRLHQWSRFCVLRQLRW